jgi:hypothetical protein
MHRCHRCPHPQKAITTVNGPTLGRSERHSGFNATKRTFDNHFNALTSLLLRERYYVSCDPVVLLDFAWLATFWVILQTLVGEEQLLAGAEDELNPTVNTPQDFVFVLVHVGPPGIFSENYLPEVPLADRSNRRPAISW